MSSHENNLVERLHAVAEGFEMPAAPLADDVRRGRRRVRRTRGLVAGVAAAMVTVVLVVTAAVTGQDQARPDRQEPVERPDVVLGAGPVWYDAKGLHHGDVVEQTPVNITDGALALVRTGALYVDPRTFDVWFHPWGGEPRIVGHDSKQGPGGDPNGDTAAWFDDSMLVVYDTAFAREIARTRQPGNTVEDLTGDHNPAGNSFLQVSAERVVWRSHTHVSSYDVATGNTSRTGVPEDLWVNDVHDQIEVLNDDGVVLRVPGRADQRIPSLEGPRVRLSPTGSYALGVEATKTRHAAAILDTSTGELWPVPQNAYPSIAWSYGNLALVDIENALLACDAVRRLCMNLAAERPLLMPTN